VGGKEIKRKGGYEEPPEEKVNRGYFIRAEHLLLT
jgi:hypothetical protein